MDPISMEPIGVFRGGAAYRYAAPPQPGLAGARAGTIELVAGKNFEAAIEDLLGFSHIWVVFLFHEAEGWRPKVQPPHRAGKRGVLATRSPHRPNPIGLSCLRLTAIEGRVLHVGETDLLDGSPVLDVKPYLPYSDSHPEASTGWVEGEIPRYRVEWDTSAKRQREWLESHGVCLDDLVERSLTLSPFSRRGHRVEELGSGSDGSRLGRLACRTWRILFRRDDDERSVLVTEIESGHSSEELAGAPSGWEDISLHRDFQQWKSQSPG